jgi:hypothetical protein
MAVLTPSGRRPHQRLQAVDDRGDALDGLIQSIMPAGPRQFEVRAVQERLLAGCPAGHDVVGDAVFGDAIAKSESQQPAQPSGTSSLFTAPCIVAATRKVVLPLPAALAVQRDQIDAMAGEMRGVRGPVGAARDQRGLALTRAQPSWPRKT